MSGCPRLMTASTRSTRATTAAASAADRGRLGSTRRATCRSGKRITRGTAAATAKMRSERSAFRNSAVRGVPHQTLIAQLREELECICLDRFERRVVLAGEQRRNRCNAARPVRELPDACADLVEGVVDAAVRVEQHEAVARLLCEHVLGAAGMTLRTDHRRAA